MHGIERPFREFKRRRMRNEGSIRTPFTELIIAAQPRLYSYALALTPDLDAANEVLQEANRVILESEDQYDPERDFLSWACGVLRYRVLGRVRDRDRDKLHFNSDLVEKLATQSALRNLASDEQRARLRSCYEKLTEHQRMLLDLRYESGSTVEAMSQSLDRPATSISSSLTKIRRKLTDCVQRLRNRPIDQGSV